MRKNRHVCEERETIYLSVSRSEEKRFKAFSFAVQISLRAHIDLLLFCEKLFSLEVSDKIEY
jgi:hypothetical protein